MIVQCVSNVLDGISQEKPPSPLFLEISIPILVRIKRDPFPTFSSP